MDCNALVVCGHRGQQPCDAPARIAEQAFERERRILATAPCQQDRRTHVCRRQTSRRLLAGIATSSSNAKPARSASASTDSKSRIPICGARKRKDSSNAALLALVYFPQKLNGP